MQLLTASGLEPKLQLFSLSLVRTVSKHTWEIRKIVSFNIYMSYQNG